MNLWILTEERPKNEVIKELVKIFAKEKKISHFSDSVRILPVLNESKKFTFTYEVVGFSLGNVKKIYLKIVSGKSSFVDFLVFFQEHEPEKDDTPVFAVEETKTKDRESRNTGIYQRAIKFQFIKLYFPNVKSIMLYNFKDSDQGALTDTNIFGSRCLRTLGVEINGRSVDDNVNLPWNSIEELIEFKSKMRRPPASNTPIDIKRSKSRITISGRLIKNDTLSHDPNIGALTLISATLRELGWKGEIEVTRHELSQHHLTERNKFILIAHKLGLTLEHLNLPNPRFPKTYWYYEKNSEKLGTIFIHVVVENFTTGKSIYENHAGCERGYFIVANGKEIAIPKKVPNTIFSRQYHKRPPGRQPTDEKIELPDLVLLDFDEVQIINIEGKTFNKVEDGIQKLKSFDAIEKHFIMKHYPDYKIIRTVVLYGGSTNSIERYQVSFLLNRHGKLVLGIRAPKIIKEAISNLRSYWNL